MIQMVKRRHSLLKLGYIDWPDSCRRESRNFGQTWLWELWMLEMWRKLYRSSGEGRGRGGRSKSTMTKQTLNLRHRDTVLHIFTYPLQHMQDVNHFNKIRWIIFLLFELDKLLIFLIVSVMIVIVSWYQHFDFNDTWLKYLEIIFLFMHVFYSFLNLQ